MARRRAKRCQAFESIQNSSSIVDRAGRRIEPREPSPSSVIRDEVDGVRRRVVRRLVRRGIAGRRGSPLPVPTGVEVPVVGSTGTAASRCTGHHHEIAYSLRARGGLSAAWSRPLDEQRVRLEVIALGRKGVDSLGAVAAVRDEPGQVGIVGDHQPRDFRWNRTRERRHWSTPRPRRPSRHRRPRLR